MFRLSPYCPERPIRTASLRSHHSGLSRIRADAVAFPIFSHVPDTNFSAAGEGLDGVAQRGSRFRARPRDTSPSGRAASVAQARTAESAPVFSPCTVVPNAMEA